MLGNSQRINSFSLVCTAPCHKEAALLIYSIRRFYECPILVISDDTTKTYLSQFHLGDVVCRPEANPEDLKAAEAAIKVDSHNTFHSKGAIYKKMDAIEWAASECGNTMFVDADIVLTSPIHMDITHPVMLSPHYHVESRKRDDWKYGGFNAGYIFTEDPSVAQTWRDIYLHRSRFYEQEGMAFFFEDYDVGKFNWFHNIGFWRNTKPLEPELPFDNALVKSIHCHFDSGAYLKANRGLTEAYDNWSGFWRDRIDKNILLFMKDIGI